jgi:hypothetical protein
LADEIGSLFTKGTIHNPAEVIEQFKIRAESMWFPSLPGINAWDISENYAEYLGFRSIERWAKTSLKHQIETKKEN